MLKLVLFVLGSIPITILSLPSLRRPGSHGFFRFFAFESLLALTLLNFDAWLLQPGSALHILSWLVLLASAALVVHGFVMLKWVGQPEGEIEATTVLVTSGAYRYIRHPLYASLLFYGVGVFLKRLSVPSGALVALAGLCLFLTASSEERENLDKFGAEYRDYMERTKRFVPFIF